MTKPRTLFDKIWDAHLVHSDPNAASILYIDRHLVHEVTSPQAFEGLRNTNRKVRSPERTLAVADHNIPTSNRSEGIKDEESRIQVETLAKNASDFSVPYFNMEDIRQGIVHVIGPEQGFTQPGMTIVCGDSHTATHGAFGALAFGIGTSEVEHVLATQTLIQKPAKNMLVEVNGILPPGVTAKDIILEIIGKIGTAGGTGYVIEYAGSTIRDLSMEGRMTICNMSIEAGARAGMIAPDEKTYEYLKGKPMSPSGDNWIKALEWWKSLPSDENAIYDKKISIDASKLVPTVTWGTSPEDTAQLSANICSNSILVPSFLCSSVITSLHKTPDSITLAFSTEVTLLFLFLARSNATLPILSISGVVYKLVSYPFFEPSGIISIPLGSAK